MLRIQQYQKVENLQEAYDLLQKNRNNQIIAGMLWLKMEDRTIPVGIDLVKLGLDQIEEDEEKFVSGASVTLRALEQHASLNKWCNNVFKDALKDIVGVQFRNLATVGGSVYSRFGFSDVLCALMCMPCDVVLYHGGKMDIESFVNSDFQRDIVTHIIVYKNQDKRSFICHRNSATDIAALNLSIWEQGSTYLINVGARPQKVKRYQLAKDDNEKVALQLKAMVECDSNMRASKAYREALTYGLCIKALKKMEEEA
ncbi:MAG: FAD binding domain-containing protein [Erysipelotrichaceae bacterium]|nr:FAD binding domain-containing protein [Erysipelotrichaceae bacterium]